MKNLAEQLKRERMRKGYSQKKLAQLAGLEQSRVSQIEHGAEVTVSTLKEISRALHLELVLVPKRLLSAVEYVVREQDDDKGEEPRRASLISSEPDDAKG